MHTIVIGAGIGGLTTALALTQKGIAVDVYEPSPVLADVGAGISLWPNALKALYQLGLRPALDGISFESMDGAVRSTDGRVLSRTTADQFIVRLGLPVVVTNRAHTKDEMDRERVTPGGRPLSSRIANVLPPEGSRHAVTAR
jgi:2-polyprenyl-6-methoxyphenol hydroxylase-like FAD-dependent oxidoreductase